MCAEVQSSFSLSKLLRHGLLLAGTVEVDDVSVYTCAETGSGGFASLSAGGMRGPGGGTLFFP